MNALADSKLRLKSARTAKGWTPERRARQAELTRLLRPWLRATGPKTKAGKARVALNALRHGYRGRAWRERARRIRRAIRVCAETVLLTRALMLRQSTRPLPFRYSRMNGLREIPVVEMEPDLPLRSLAIDDRPDGRELQPQPLVVVEAGDLVRRLPPGRAP